MSIVKKGFRYRLSNVLAWVGSLGGGLVNLYVSCYRCSLG